MILLTPSKKSAFTMLELVFVIVILGIVASIGSQIIVQVYESYLVQRAVHRSTIKTELVAVQLANRLAYSVPGTVIGRNDDNITFDALNNIVVGADRTILEWIGSDEDSFGSIDAGAGTGLTRRPIWSGYCDVDDPSNTITSLSTPGSRLSDLSTIIGSLSSSTITDAAILFPDTYDVNTIGYAGGVNNFNINPVAGQTSDTKLTLDVHQATRVIKEHYKLAWTAYAVVPTPVTDVVARGFQAGETLWDLTFYYDYQPWDGENYGNGSSQILLRNVSVFNFTGAGDTIRFKICQRENVGGTFSINSCKEKAVIR